MSIYKHMRKVALTPKQKQRLYAQMQAGKPAMLSLKAEQLGHGDDLAMTKAQANAADLGKPMKMKLSHAQLMAQGQVGGSIWSDIGDWFTTAAEDTGKAFKSAASDVGSTILDVVNDPTIKSVLRPLLVSGAGSAGAALGTATGIPALGALGGVVGSKAGDALLKQLGYGLRPQAGGALDNSGMVGLDMTPEQLAKLLNVLEASQEYLTSP